MSIKEALNRANPNTISDHMREVAIGQVLRGQVLQVLRKKAPALDAAVLATLASIKLPNDAKAASIIRATGRVGTVTGEFAPQAFGATPATAQVAVAPNGDIVFLNADAITNVDVTYVPERADVFVTLALPVTTNVLTLPSPATTRGVVLLIDALAVTGTAVGRKIILVPGAGAPAAGQARLNVAKTTVTFAVADAVTTAIVTLGLAALADLDTVLESAETTV